MLIWQKFTDGVRQVWTSGARRDPGLHHDIWTGFTGHHNDGRVNLSAFWFKLGASDDESSKGR